MTLIIGKSRDGADHGLDEDGRESDLFAFAVSNSFFTLFAPVHHVGHVGFHETGHVRADVLAHHHVVGDQLAHAVHFHDLHIAAHTNDFLFLTPEYNIPPSEKQVAMKSMEKTTI